MLRITQDRENSGQQDFAAITVVLFLSPLSFYKVVNIDAGDILRFLSPQELTAR